MHWFLKTILADDGSTMAFLQGRGVDVSVIQFVLSQADSATKSKMVSVLAKNPQVTIPQLQQMVPQKVQQEANAPQEVQMVQRFADPEFQKWLLVNMRKMRAAAGGKTTAIGPSYINDPGLYYLIQGKIYPLQDVANDITTWSQEIWDWYRGCVIASRQAIMGINDPEQVAAILVQYGVENPNINLASLDFPTAKDYSDEWHELMAGRGNGAMYYGEKPEDTVFGPQWSNPQWQGWTIKQVKTENNLLAEGNKVGHCFAAGSLVRTQKGFVPIEDIKIGDMVLTENGSFRKVTHLFERDYSGDMIKLVIRLGVDPILVTPNHQFMSLVSRHKGDDPCKLHTCGSLSHGNNPEEKHDIDWNEIKNLSADSYLLTKTPNEFRDIDVIDISDEFVVNKCEGNTKYYCDSNLLWIMGMYIAEGSNDGNKLSFALSKDENEYAKRIINFFTQNGFHPYVRKDAEDYGGLVIYISSRMLCRWFSEWFGCGCSSKKIPFNLLNLPNEKIIHLWQGIFDGDGCKSRNVLHQTSSMLCLQMAEISLRLGGLPSISVKDNSKRCRKVAYVLEGADGSIIRSSRKRGFWTHKEHTLIKPIKYEVTQFKGKVYNIEVEDIHSYVVQHLVVHNCVGGQDYCRRVARGDTRIFSLRDPSNTPYVTMEVAPKNWHFMQIYGNGPKTGNRDPNDNLKAMIGEWMKTLTGATVEGADGFDYGELKYDNSYKVLENCIYGGLEGYGLAKDISGFDVNEAYEAILKTMEDHRDNYAPRDTYSIAEVLGRAAVDADMARVQNGTFMYKNIEREATALMKRDRKNYKAKDVKRIPPEIYQNLMAQVMTEWNDMRLQEEQEWWLRGKSQQERRAKFDQRRNEIVLSRYNDELKYPNAQTLADVPPEEVDRFLRTAVDKRSSIDEIDSIRQKNSEQLWENWERSDIEHIDRDEYTTEEEYEAAVEKAEQEAQEADDDAQDDYMKHHLPYALDNAMYEKAIQAMHLGKFRLPRWMIQRWGKSGNKPGLMHMYDQAKRLRTPRSKKMAMNWYKAAMEMGLFGQDPAQDSPLPDQGNRPLFDVSKIPARVPRGTDVMEELDSVQDLKSALALLDQYGIGYDTIQWPGGASPVYVFESPSGETTVLEFDQGVLSLSEANQWVTDLNDLSLDNYVPMPDYNDEFWAGVGAGSKLYHGTNRDYVDSILRRGLDPRSETRGLSNKFTGDAVFMSETPEGTVPYGDMVIEIDIGAMKAAGYMPQVSGETPLADDQQREAIAWRLGLENYYSEDRGWEGIAPDTVVMYGRIPAKFVKVRK